jgi:F420-dependent oxidoreductase-like protein
VNLCLMIEGQESVTWPQWLALAQACEETGIPALFRSDHYMSVDPRHPERSSLDAWATLTALAAATSTLRLGTMVSPALFRHPSNLAKVVATADHVSGGRMELGLGAGWNEREHEAYGFPFPSLGERMDVLEEQLTIVHGAWTESPFSFVGAHYGVRDLDAQPRPVQTPHPPLIMGGAAGPRSAALAARFADEYNIAYVTVDAIAERRARIAAACERAGRAPIPLSVMTGVIVGSDAGEVRDRAHRISQIRGDDPDRLLSGSPSPWVVGTVPQATEQLIALRDAGVSRVMCQHLAHDDVEMVTLLGREVAPLLAED